MCGIVGFVNVKASTLEELSSICNKMASQIINRGPDGGGVWADPETNVALGHRRLKIVDLSEAGFQPMHSSDSRYVIAFNGEIYNNSKLRRDHFPSHAWRGTSDTETLLACIELFGVREALIKIEGMFAIAVWDRMTSCLYLARDRIGEKPLYYGWQGSGENRSFLFASDLAALRVHPSFDNVLNIDSLEELIYMNYVGNGSIYSGIKKLEPGTFLSVSAKSMEIESDKYWDIKKFHGTNDFSSNNKTYNSYVSTLESTLLDVIKSEMVSDVPLGAFLSGGIDSSLIVALMQSISSKPIKTFTIGFNESNFNEACYAKEVAKYLGTDHTEVYLDSTEALRIIENLPSVYTEPFADSSQIPTLLLCGLAKKSVTVSLSGDGGDELFYGYSRYRHCSAAWKLKKLMPNALVGLASRLAKGVDVSLYNRLFGNSKSSLVGDRIHKIFDLLGKNNFNEIYYNYITNCDQSVSLLNRSNVRFIANLHSNTYADDVCREMVSIDIDNYLRNDILVKVDRASMYYSLETRAPFLHPSIVEIALGIPFKYKSNGRVNKLPLREILFRYIPKEYFHRPKMGFGVPVGSWIRGPLNEWANDHLSYNKLKSQGLFDAGLVTKYWEEHKSGVRNWQSVLWAILMFQQWASHNKVNIDAE